MYHHRILIADADPVIRRYIRTSLESRDNEIFLATNGIEALKIIENQSPDLIIMDISLPGIDGLELCRHIREVSPARIIVLGTLSDELRKVRCLNAGADDYLTKPFSLEELIARTKAVLRRNETFTHIPSQASFANNGSDIKIRFAERQVTVRDREVKLTPTEYKLLEELALNPNKVLTHSLLLSKIWGPEFGQEREYLRVFVGRLRRKLEPNPRKPNFIITVPWVGYKLNAALR